MFAARPRAMVHSRDTTINAASIQPTGNPRVTATIFGASEKAAEFRGFSMLEILERVKRFERSTPTLARLCSTPELHPLARPLAASRAYMAEEHGDCNREIAPFLAGMDEFWTVAWIRNCTTQ